MNPFTIGGLILLGWLVGAGVNYLGDVLPITRRLTPVLCKNCNHPYGWIDTLFYRRCSGCGNSRGTRPWVVQVLALAAILALGLLNPGKLGFWASLPVVFYFGVVILIDIEHRLIMHPVSLVGAGLGLVIGTWQHGILATGLGGLAGLTIMLAVYWLGGLFAKWLAKRRKVETEEEALGFGDVALSGVLGLLLGWPGIGAGLVLAVLLGGAGSLAVIIYAVATKKYHAFMAVPYGPFLITAAAVLLFWGR